MATVDAGCLGRIWTGCLEALLAADEEITSVVMMAMLLGFEWERIPCKMSSARIVSGSHGGEDDGEYFG